MQELDEVLHFPSQGAPIIAFSVHFMLFKTACMHSVLLCGISVTAAASPTSLAHPKSSSHGSCSSTTNALCSDSLYMHNSIYYAKLDGRAGCRCSVLPVVACEGGNLVVANATRPVTHRCMAMAMSVSHAVDGPKSGLMFVLGCSGFQGVIFFNSPVPKVRAHLR